MKINLSLSLKSLLAFSLVTQGMYLTPLYAEIAAAKQPSKKATLLKVKNALKKNGLSKLPSSSSALAAKKKAKNTKRSGAIGAFAVQGTPPALVEIPDTSIKDLFWREGVIDNIIAGNASQEECGELFLGDSDGSSGGFSACHMAESVGYSFADVLNSETSLCYMKKFPTAANLAAEGLTVDAGTVPSDDITKLFSVPTGDESRVVKVNVLGGGGGEGPPEGQNEEEGESGGPETVMIRVFSQDENKTDKDLYRVDLWFCGSEGQVTGFNKISISGAGKFEADIQESQGSSQTHKSFVSGFLIPSGSGLTFDTSRARTALVQSFRGGGEKFKGLIELSPNNLITAKTLDNGGGTARRALTITKFSGANPLAVRFLEGAFIDQRDEGSGFEDGTVGATEYRNGYYASAPSNALIARVQNKDFDSDDFYDDYGDSEIDTSEFSCETEPDVEVTLDMSNETLRNSVSSCENEEFRNMHFCHDDQELRLADEARRTSCDVGNGPGGPGQGGPDQGGPGEGGPGPE